MRPVVLTIAGSDPSGGAGIQADIKTITAHGAYAMAVPTCLTVQNTQGVRSVHVPPAGFLADQLDALSDDFRIDAVKIGMLARADLVEVVTVWLPRIRPSYVVLDPVMVATSGDRLLEREAVQALRTMARRVDLVTPNLPELAALLDEPVATDWDRARDQGLRLAGELGALILVKGGHLRAPTSPDALVDPDGAVMEFSGDRVDTPNVHGTGCALSSALAALRPSRPDWVGAVRDAKAWTAAAIRSADRLQIGRGAGPVDHLHADAPHEAVPFSVAVWRRTAALREAIDRLPFLVSLAEGTLPGSVFAEYLRQDGLYLGRYAGVLSALAAMADRDGHPDEQELWAQAAGECAVVERSLHEAWLAAAPASSRATTVGPGGPIASTVCEAYCSYLESVSALGSYAQTVAAVMPCFVVYSDVGDRLLGLTANLPDHPYREWIDQYADPGFAGRCVQVRAIADRLGSVADEHLLERMQDAFETATRYEWMFWDAPWWPVPTTGLSLPSCEPVTVVLPHVKMSGWG